MKKNKTEKGITLVALIITIIVLLILAVVAIGVVTGEGILFHAKDAASKYAEDAAIENTTLQSYAEILKEQITGVGKVAVGTIAEKNSTLDGEVPSAKNPIIPAGFMAKNTEAAKWDAEGGPEVDKGLVITDVQDPENATGNEFVWVPITENIKAYGLGTTNRREPDVITGEGSTAEDSASGSEYDAVEANLTLAGFTEDLNGDGKVNAYDFKIQIINDFNRMAASVNTYRGFYVGRYETSLDSNGMGQSVYGKAWAKSSGNGYWYGLYRIQREYSTSSVQGSMLWGSQYDAMMEWMDEEAINTTIEEKNTGVTTGTAPSDVINNVYDLYGGCYEYLLEANDTIYRGSRGGNRGYSVPPFRQGKIIPTDNHGNVASRMSIYIK